MNTTDRKVHQLIPYLELRQLIGASGIVLPIICIMYGLFFEMSHSISDFYYSGVRDVFVGILFALGFFLFTYKGYDAKDSTFANFGFVFALGVALFPCRSEVIIFDIHLFRVLHFVCAGLLFCVFIWFSLKQFTKSVKEAAPTESRVQRNTIYLICGYVMIGCITGIILSFIFLSAAQREHTNIIFWLESVALWFFGFSWLTKGKFMWKDK